MFPYTAAAVAAAPVALTAAGFTASGIAAGSVASWMMSFTAVASGGGVAAGSVVAVLQGAGEPNVKNNQTIFACTYRFFLHCCSHLLVFLL